MRRASLAEAKASLGALVEEAERRHQPILIPRHGRPAAAIVPVDVAVAAQRGGAVAKKGLSEEEIQELFAGLGTTSTDVSAVEELLSGRR